MRRTPATGTALVAACIFLILSMTGTSAEGSAPISTTSAPPHDCHFDAFPHGYVLKNAVCNAKADDFATFDADNTLWKNDLTEALLPYLENRGILSLTNLDPALKLITPKSHESLYGYYVRLCEETNEDTCFQWIAQSFSGLSLATLKQHVDAMMESQAAIPVTYYHGETLVNGEVFPPKIYPVHRTLVNDLRARGIHVYVLTAAVEEIARMVLADPKYGFGFEPADIIGVTLLLKDPHEEKYTTARQQIAAGHFLDEEYTHDEHMRKVLTSSLSSPATWFIGKKSAIENYIHPYRRPIIVAGDARTDWEMLFHAHGSHGARIWVIRGKERLDALKAEQLRRAIAQKDAGVPADAHQQWTYVTPQSLEVAQLGHIGGE